MSLFLHVLQPTEIDEILAFESRKMAEKVTDEMERQIQSWNARWRKESLQHYVPLGWSFCARESSSPESPLVGYFIAQALLFLDGQTQTLWVEHLQFSSLQIRDALVELAVKLGREKHLQKIYFPNEPTIANALQPYKSEPWSASVLQVRTTKT